MRNIWRVRNAGEHAKGYSLIFLIHGKTEKIQPLSTFCVGGALKHAFVWLGTVITLDVVVVRGL